ncbi:TonB-dependent receptor [Rhodobacter capsulatus]
MSCRRLRKAQLFRDISHAGPSCPNRRSVRCRLCRVLPCSLSLSPLPSPPRWRRRRSPIWTRFPSPPPPSRSSSAAPARPSPSSPPKRSKKAPLGFADYLSTLPGITLSANGGLGTQTSLRVRGLPAYYLGTRIDGINVTDAANPQVSYSFGGLTTAGLSRIEVLRGAQSALYGSEAVAGGDRHHQLAPRDRGQLGPGRA